MYEFVPMEFTVTNVSGEPVGVFHPCAGLGGIEFAVWDPVGPDHPESEAVWFCCGCYTMTWLDTLDVGESYHREVTWDMHHICDEQLTWRAGTYTLEGNISLASYPGLLALTCTLRLEVQILPGAAGLREDDGVPWGRIKALYR